MTDYTYDSVYARDLRVGDILRWYGEITEITWRGDYCKVYATGLGDDWEGWHSDDDVTIVERPYLGKVVWVLAGYVEGGYDDGSWQQHIAAFEDPADAMIYGDNEYGVDHEWCWDESEGRFFGAPTKQSHWDSMYVEPMTLWESW